MFSGLETKQKKTDKQTILDLGKRQTKEFFVENVFKSYYNNNN